MVSLLVPPGMLLEAQEPAKPERTVQGCLEMLRSDDSRAINQAVDGVLDSRTRLIEQLIPMIDPANAGKYSDETRCAAAFLLGELRSVEAVPVLSKALADEPGRKIVGMNRFDVPVWSALVKIGRPAVPAMIENIESSDQEVLWGKSMDVLGHVLGGKRRVLELLARLQDRAEKDDVKRARIVRATKYAEEFWTAKEESLY